MTAGVKNASQLPPTFTMPGKGPTPDGVATEHCADSRLLKSSSTKQHMESLVNNKSLFFFMRQILMVELINC